MEESFCRLGIFIRPRLQYLGWVFFCASWAFIYVITEYILFVFLFLYLPICQPIQHGSPCSVLKFKWLINIGSLTCKIFISLFLTLCVCMCVFLFSSAFWLSADLNQCAQPSDLCHVLCFCWLNIFWADVWIVYLWFILLLLFCPSDVMWYHEAEFEDHT